MTEFLPKRRISLPALLWLTLVSVVMLLEVMGSAQHLYISREYIPPLITAISSIVFIAMLVLAWLLFSLPDRKKEHD